MLRPEKGEGERPAKFYNSIKKAPLIFTTALLVGYPLCLGQAALASTSSFGLHSQLDQSRTARHTRSQSLPKMSQGLRLLSSSSIPSDSQISSLTSILASYQIKLADFVSKVSSRPDLADTLAPIISILQQQVSSLAADISAARTLLDSYNTASTTLTRLVANYNLALAAQAKAQSNLQDSMAAYTSKQNNLTIAQGKASLAKDSLTKAIVALDQANADLQSAKDAKSAAQDKVNVATSALADAQAAEDLALVLLANANQTLATAQATADASANLIPDPTWVRPMVQVSHTREIVTTTQVPREVSTVIPTGLTADSFNRQGYSSRPPLPTALETPIATLNVPNIDFQWGGGQVLNSGRTDRVLVRFTGYISPSTTGDYQFYAPGDDGVIVDVNGQRVINDWFDKGGGGSISSTVILTAGTPVPFTLYFYENGGGANVWLYYSTPQGMQLVPFSWFGSSTTVSTVYDTVSTTTIETYYTTEPDTTAQPNLIQDPTLVQATADAQARVDQAVTNLADATLSVGTARDSLASAQAVLNATSISFNKTTQVQTVVTSTQANSSAILDAANANVMIASLDLATANNQTIALTSSLDTANQTLSDTLSAKTLAEANVTAASSKYIAATDHALSIQPDFASADTALLAPIPEPKGSKDLPTIISADSLLSIDLSAVTPTEMSVEQASALKSAALETFNTADPGSPAYGQALTALLVVAQQDDIVLSPELAAIPGLQAATQLVNFLGNAGADMSPKTREESKKIVVAAVVAAGAAVQAAAGAAASASSSSTTRRK